jgi:3-phosphoshikimate 1-carboxyvinyltransferase
VAAGLDSLTIVPAWIAPTATAPVDAVVAVPGSKSMTNRALILSALADGPSKIADPLDARDTQLMAAALRDLGASLSQEGQRLLVHPGTTHGEVTVNCGLSGTVMRFTPPVAALTGATARFTGDEQARARPMAPLLDGLRTLGVHVEGDRLPFTVAGDGAVVGGPVALDASGSSQFVSALLLSGALFDDGVEIRTVGGPVPNLPHLTMTERMLAAHGVRVERGGAEQSTSWRVRPTALPARDWAIEPDLSNATPFMAAAMLTAGRIRIPGIGTASVQPVAQVRALFEAMGATVLVSPDAVTVSGNGRVRPVDLDLRDLGELTPTVTALLLVADGASRLRGIGYLRGHETDRLAALATDAERIGGRIDVTEDGLVVTPGPLRADEWRSHHDHRMATAGAILGLVVPGLTVDDIGATAKTMPEFPSLWQQMLTSAA